MLNYDSADARKHDARGGTHIAPQQNGRRLRLCARLGTSLYSSALGSVVSALTAFLVEGLALAQQPAAPANSVGSPPAATGSALDTIAQKADDATTKADQATKKADEAAKSADDAKKTAAAANANAQAAADAASEAKLADLKGGKFIRYGVSAGLAFAIETSSIGHAKSGATQESTASTTMPYLVVVPGYWGLGDVTITYCAAKYAGDEVLAVDAAASYARRKALATMDLETQKQYAAGDSKAQEKVQSKANSYWNRDARGSCGWTQWGAFIGKPLTYDASVSALGGALPSKRDVSPIYALGISYLPNSYVTLLAGISVNSITDPATEATETAPAGAAQLHRFVSVVAGIGGNLDIVGVLFH